MTRGRATQVVETHAGAGGYNDSASGDQVLVPATAPYQAYESDFAPSTSLETLAGAAARADDTATYLFYGAR